MSTRNNGVAEVVESGLQLPRYDDAVNTPTTLTDVWQFRIGGPSAAVICTVTLTYSDSTKNTLLHVERFPLLK